MRYENRDRIVQLLQMAGDYLEGEYSGIPSCCIREFVENKRTYYEFKKTLSKENLLKIKKFNYVPCDSCLERCEPIELKLGATEYYEELNALMGKIYHSGEKLSLYKKRGVYVNYRKTK